MWSARCASMLPARASWAVTLASSPAKASTCPRRSSGDILWKPPSSAGALRHRLRRRSRLLSAVRQAAARQGECGRDPAPAGRAQSCRAAGARADQGRPLPPALAAAAGTPGSGYGAGNLRLALHRAPHHRTPGPSFYLWLEMPPGLDEEAICRAAAEQSIFLAPSAVFRPGRRFNQAAFRMNIAHSSHPKLLDFLRNECTSRDA